MKQSFTSIFKFLHSDKIVFPYKSFPTAEINLVFISNLLKFSAIFLPTPPIDMSTLPGLESCITRGLFGNP